MKNSKHLFECAQRIIPSGVNSPVRAFHGVGGDPLFFERGEGAYLFDADNNRYIDYVASWGPLILGHAHPDIVNATQQALAKGLSFGASTQVEVQLAQRITNIMPAIEKVRMVNSGTEATMSAIRLARGFTGRDKIIKFIGCYHGHSDCLLVKTGSGGITFSIPNSAGVPKSITEHTLLADFNNLDHVSQLFEQYGNDIAAVIVEPVAGNMGCILPDAHFLQGLRDITKQYQSLLIFDEVITGFRVALGGASAYFNIKPDLTTLGKIIGGGMPVGAFGGRADIMDYIAPQGPVYQAGTLSGNPVAMTAGLKTLDLISAPDFFEKLDAQTHAFISSLEKLAQDHNVPLKAHRIGSMFGLFFTDQKTIRNYADVMQSNVEHFKHFFQILLKEGVYIAPSAYESGFLSAVHTTDDIEKTLKAAEKAFLTMPQ